MPERPDSLLRAAVLVAANAYAPYSKFAAGAAVESKDGSVFTGTNMENASYGLSICAEVGALQASLAGGKHNQIVRMAVVGGLIDAAHRNGEIVTPCGRCRQIIYEASVLSGVDIEVWCADIDLQSVACYRISELIPHAFGPADLSSR
jgi:cytidine deaminase